MLDITLRLHAYSRLMRLDKPIGILLLLWPTLWALWLAAHGMPPLHIVIIFIVGTCLMRSAGCVINDYADRNFDAHVTRTAQRPLAQQQILPIEALGLFVVLLLSAAGLLLALPPFCWLLAVIAVVIIIVYPFTKRYLSTPQVILGLAFAWGIPMAYVAILGTITVTGWLLFILGIIWPVIYDTMYAMVDRADDLTLGIKSTAILFGAYDRIIIGLLQVLWLILWLYLAHLLHLHMVFYASLAITAGLNVYQQCLIAAREPAACFQAFLNNNWVGLIICCGLMASC